MLYAKADQQTLGYLGRALSLEFTAVQQYATQAKLVSSWGLVSEASKLQEESLEEMGHVERIISRMLGLGVTPGASMLRPARTGANLREILLADAALERDLVKLYSQAVHHCIRHGDNDNRKFFAELLKEEQAHDLALSRWINNLDAVEAAQSSRVTF